MPAYTPERIRASVSPHQRRVPTVRAIPVKRGVQHDTKKSPAVASCLASRRLRILAKSGVIAPGKNRFPFLASTLGQTEIRTRKTPCCAQPAATGAPGRFRAICPRIGVSKPADVAPRPRFHSQRVDSIHLNKWTSCSRSGHRSALSSRRGDFPTCWRLV